MFGDMRPSKCKAKDLNGEWVTGWYVEHHITETDSHDKVTGYKTIPCIFNDEPGNRGNGGYWHEIQPDTLQEFVEPKQLTLF